MINLRATPLYNWLWAGVGGSDLSINVSFIFALKDMAHVTWWAGLALKEGGFQTPLKSTSLCPLCQVAENAFVQSTSRHGDGRL